MRRARVLIGLILASGLGLGASTSRAAITGAYEPGEVIVKYRAAVPIGERGALRSAVRATVVSRFDFIRAEYLRLEGELDVEAAIARLSADPRVEYAEPNYLWTGDVVPSDTLFPTQYGMRNTGQGGGTIGADIRAAQAWDLYTGDPDLRIGVIDTGIDYNHPDLAANIWTNPNEIAGNLIDDDANGYVDDVHGYDFANKDGDPMDDHGHGTHCAGTIAARGNDVTGIAGLNWQAKLVAIKFLRANNTGSTTAAIGAIRYSIDTGLRLTNNSWGGPAFSQALLDAVTAANQAGQLFVASAGNASSNNDAVPSYPASYPLPCVLAVAATDHNDLLANFSNYGLTSVDLAAPGASIVSSHMGGGYLTRSGTSMAAPHVTGTAALLMGRAPSLTNLEVRARILATAHPLASLSGKVATGARLDAYAAIDVADAVAPAGIIDLVATQPGSNSMRLSWTAPGDDGAIGSASRYEIHYSRTLIDAQNFAGEAALPPSAPAPGGSAESREFVDLPAASPLYFAIRALDEMGNAGPISNVVLASTLEPPTLAVDVDSLSAALLTGGLDSAEVVLSNVGPGTLDFVIPPPLTSAQDPWPYLSIPKDGLDSRVGTPVLDGSGAAPGYRWIDSDAPGGPAFDWVDITGLGDPFQLSGDDVVSLDMPLGFEFPFYGGLYDTLRISTNGFLSLAGAAAPFDNQPLPNLGAPRALIAPLWDDLEAADASHLFFHVDSTRAIVSWVGIARHSGEGTYSFQAILRPSGDIRFQYQSLTGTTESATVGIQSEERDAGVNIAFNTPYLHDALAIDLRRVPQWLTVTPASGRIPAGQNRTVVAHFDATSLPTGTFRADIDVSTNDPTQATAAVPARLDVTAAPDLAVSPEAVPFGSVPTGGTAVRTLTVVNRGWLPLIVSSIGSAAPSIVVQPSSFTLAPQTVRTVSATFHPTSPGLTSSTIVFASNDPDHPSLVLPANGVAIPAPQLALDADSFHVVLPTGGTTTRTLRVSNLGAVDYHFTARAVNGIVENPVVYGDPDNVPLAKGQDDVMHGPVALAAGGPDGFGYTYIDSDQPGGPAFAWEDVSAIGTALPLTGDDSNAGRFPIGFEFPFYDAEFDSFRVCTNGWISFTSNQGAFDNTSLPNNGISVPENLVAVYWDDFNFGAVQRAYYHSDGNRLVVQYQGVRRINETAANTFQVILRPDGSITYQYLTMNAQVLNSATIGIQNGARNDGLQVAFNVPYVHNDLAVHFRRPHRFLSVTPELGTVPPGQFVDLTLGFDAESMPDGPDDAVVRIEGDDPIRPLEDVGCSIDVLAPRLVATPSALAFGEVTVGPPAVLPLQVRNAGRLALAVEAIVSTLPVFDADPDQFTVEPGDSAAVQVAFDPVASGPVSGRLDLQTNDPQTPLAHVAVSGTGFIPTEIQVSPNEARVALATTLGPVALAQDRHLVLVNQGGSPLRWSVGAVGPGGPSRAPIDPAEDRATPAPHMNGELPKDDPGSHGPPQNATSGGPDASGYRWVDSRNVSGPAFDWQEISATGTPIAFTSDDQTLGPFPLPFPFQFYGVVYDSFRVCSNGWIGLGSGTDSTYTNVALPGAAAPKPLIAPFWDDLDFRSAGSAYLRNDGDRVIVEFKDVPRYGSGGPYTFELLLHADGTIDVQYLAMVGTRKNEATIGIQNAAATRGLQVVHNGTYVRDSLRVRFSRAPGWLSFDRTAGTTAPGVSDTVVVHVAADGLADGDYAAVLAVASNDADESLVTLPVALHVGVVAAGLDVDASLSGVAGPRWVDAEVSPPSPFDPADLSAASLRLATTVGVAPGTVPVVQPTFATFAFNRLSVLAAIGSGEQVPVSLIGEVTGETWIAAEDSIRMLRPPFTSQFAPPFATGALIPLHWEAPPGTVPVSYDLWYTPDAGATWTPVALGLETNGHSWSVPIQPTTQAALELMAFDGIGYTGSSVLGPFVVTLGATDAGDASVPIAFSLRSGGPNPARGTARMELSLPTPGDVLVRVYDVRGALVRTLARGRFEAGRHPVVWDGRDTAGREIGSGVYFVRASSGRGTVGLRLAWID